MLSDSFFARDTETVARELLGKKLVRLCDDGSKQTLIINETEAYVGPHDLACHAAKGRTKRTAVMYGPPGSIYMYLIYGMYWMLNIVTEEENYPAAVLIRGIHNQDKVLDGPGKLTRELAIDKSLNGLVLGQESGLWIAEGASLNLDDIIATPRIGIDYAGPEWKNKPLRFVLSPAREEVE